MDTTNLVSWLPFDESPTLDKCGNEWTAYGNATIGTNGAINGKALQLATVEDYVKLDGAIELGGRDFTVDFWLMIDSVNIDLGAVFTIYEGTTRFISLFVDSSTQRLNFRVKEKTQLFSFERSNRAHVSVNYQHSSGITRLFVNGVLAASITQSLTRTELTFVALGTGTWSGAQNFIGTIDEFMIYDGVALHTENFTPPTAEDYVQLALDMGGVVHYEISFDLQRKLTDGRSPLASYISFTGNAGCYGELPLAVLAGATTFTIEAKFSTTSTKNNSSNWTWGTIAGREIGGNWQDDFGFCVNDGKLCFWAEPKSGGSNSTKNTTSNATVNDGQIHKVAVVSSGGAIDLYCDGVKVAHKDNVNAKISASQTILLAYDSDPASYLQMDLYEARFWSVVRTQEQIFADIDGTEQGLEAWYIPNGSATLPDLSTNGRNATLYGSPTYTELMTLPLDLTFDVERKVKNADKLWRYFNKGTADTLTISGTTLTALPESQSKTGTAFVQTARQKCFDIPATPEIWIKFDVYFNGSNRWRAYNGGANGTTGLTAQTDGRLSFFANDSVAGDFSGICIANQLQTVLLHMISGSSASIIEAWVDGEKIYRYTGDVNHGEDFADIYLQTDGNGTFFSNVIISNGEIGLEEGWQIFSFDAERHLRKNFALTFDVERNIENTTHYEISADVVIRDILPVNFRADVERKLIEAFSFGVDVEIQDVIIVEVIADIERNVSGNVEMFATDTAEYFSGGGSAPVVIPSQEIIPPATQNTDGLQSIEISIAAQQLTDQISIVGVVPFDVLNQVKGTYLDYNFDMRVALMKKQGILRHCETCLDIDEILFTPLNYSLPSMELSAWYIEKTVYETFFIFPEASKHVEKIAAALGLQPVMQFKDFYSTVEVGESEEDGASYNDLIRDIFGWSSRVPTELINVFIRDGCLFVIQRGYESNLIDISASKHTLPIVEHKLMRMFYQRKKFSHTETRQRSSPRKSYAPNIPKEKPEDDKPDSGGSGGSGDAESPWLATGSVTTTDSEGTTVTTYYYTSDGVLTKTVAQFTSSSNAEENSTTTTSNYYNDDGTLASTTVEAIHPQAEDEDTKTVTTYGYMTLGNGKKFLSTEMIEKYSIGENGSWELEDTRITTKSPTGRGQGATTDDKGNSSASGNIGDDRVSPYSADNPTYDNPIYSKPKSGSSGGGGGGNTIDEYRDIEGLTLIDTSFPIQNISSEEFDFLPWDWDAVRDGKATVTIDGKPVSPDFNIEDIDTAKGRGRLRELTDAIKWLNRKTQETVTLTLYEFPHLINLNDRILLDGNIYFLENNVAKTTPRIFNEQALTLVRWF